MGRAPIRHPPGSASVASPQRASSGPSASTDARVSPSIAPEALARGEAHTMSSAPPSLRTAPPRSISICAMRPTSVSSGASSMRTGSSVSSAAAICGSTAFFARATRTSPRSGSPPSISHISIRALRFL